jgi:hypothetical protein
MATREYWMNSDYVRVRRDITTENLNGNDLIAIIHKYNLENTRLGFSLSFKILDDDIEEDVSIHCRNVSNDIKYRPYYKRDGDDE